MSKPLGPCPDCAGRGYYFENPDDPFEAERHTCDRCGGTGHVPTLPPAPRPADREETTRELVLERLLELPGELAEAEQRVLSVSCDLLDAKRALEISEDLLLTSGEIDGRNEATRTAQLRELTRPQRDQLDRITRRQAEAQAKLRNAQAELSALRAAARLLGGGDL